MINLIKAFLLISISININLFSVELNVPEDYDNIQAAITYANNGDTVNVATGTYTGYGNVNINFYGKSIYLNGNNSTLDADHNHRLFYFNSEEDTTTVVEGFTIREGASDITEDGDEYISTFMISAHTGDPELFYLSDPSSGYSIDNIEPETPENVFGSYSFINENDEYISDVFINWDPLLNTPDFDYIEIYNNDNLYGYTIQTGSAHVSIEDFPYSFTIKVYDYNGNSSDFSLPYFSNETLGDLNQDHTINVSDAVMMVDAILLISETGILPNDFIFTLSELYIDNEVNVIDLVALINIILDI